MNRKNYISIFLLLLLTCNCKGQSTLTVLHDKEQKQICILKDDKQKQYCFDIPDFFAYDRRELSLQNKEVLIHYSGAFTAYIDTKWEFDETFNKLILKNITGAFPDNFDYDGRIKICSIIEINKSIEDIDTEYFFDKLTSDTATFCHYEYNNLPPLQEIFERMSKESRKDKYFLNTYGSDIDRYKSYLKTYPISDKNYIQYNDMGYYLEQAGNYIEAIYILKIVIEKYPQRVVAYLNIADVYWGNNEKEGAKKMYEKYIELMKNQKKDLSKIPQRVYDRIK